MHHYAPTYPVLLAVAGLFQHNAILKASRELTAVLFGVNLILMSLVIYRSTERNLLAVGCAMLVFLVSTPIILEHSMVLSEPPFIAFTLASILSLTAYVIRPRLIFLIFTSIFIGLAVTTRYIGVALLPAMAFVLLFFGDRPNRDKFKDSIVATIIACLPLLSWFIYNFMTQPALTDRTFALHRIPAGDLIDTIYSFEIPISLSFWPRTLCVGVAAILFLIAIAVLHKTNYIRRNANSACIALTAFCLVFSLAYITVLVISMSLFDAATPFDGRILSPVLLTLTIASISLAWSLARALQQKMIWYGFVLFTLFSVSIHSIRGAVPLALDLHKNGSGYNSRSWRNSEVVSYLANVYDSRKIYSNAPDAIEFLTNKKAVMVPQKISPFTLRLTEGYEQKLDQILRECEEGKVLIVYLDARKSRWYLPSIEELRTKSNMPILGNFEDGVVYGRNAGSTIYREQSSHAKSAIGKAPASVAKNETWLQ